MQNRVQFQAKVHNGKVITQSGFFFPGLGFNYRDDSGVVVVARFMRDPANIHKVVYAFFYEQETLTKKEKASPFLKLTHPDYAPEEKPGIYIPAHKLPVSQKLAMGVCCFLGITIEKNYRHYFVFSKQNNAEEPLPQSAPNAENNGMSQNLQAAKKLSFEVWQNPLIPV